MLRYLLRDLAFSSENGAVLCSAIFFLVSPTSSSASTFCIPGQRGAPGYCDYVMPEELNLEQGRGSSTTFDAASVARYLRMRLYEIEGNNERLGCGSLRSKSDSDLLACETLQSEKAVIQRAMKY